MGLATGTKIGTYEIVEAAGSGGMGEVYRARDLKLGRDVALKVLPASVSSDPARMARFHQEARVLASLNHPNIGSIYGIEDSQLQALVLEYVEGLTLADRILDGPVSPDEALAIARQIAEALEYAHERGITHRDLKPANVKLCPDGQVKVLDFGLAKVFTTDIASSADAANSPTFTAMATQAGVLLGTAAYMSPEQAKGKAVDRRTDIWAFGCVLFEMLSGRRPFEGETVTDTLAAIVRGEPDWQLIPAGASHGTLELLRRCLQKDPKKRLQAIGDARLAIDDALSLPASAPLADFGLSAKRSTRTALPWILCSALVLALLIMGLAWWNRKPQMARAVQFEIPIAQSDSPQVHDSLQFEGQSPIAISSDGLKLAFTLRHNGIGQLYMRSLESPDPVVVPNTEGAFGPFFSPDDQWIGYFVPGKIMKVSTIGGAPIELCAIGENPRGATWGKNGFIYFAPISTGGLMKVSDSGGSPQPFTPLNMKNNERTHRWPSVLPDGKHVIFTVGKADSPEYYDDAEIYMADTQTGERTLIWKGSSMAKYVSGGQLLYARAGKIYAVTFDVSAKKVSGPSREVLSGVAGDVSTGAVFFSSGETDLAVVEGGPILTNRSSFAWVDLGGRITKLAAPAHNYRDIQLSPDGTKIAVIFAEKTQDVWIYDIRTDNLTRLTYEGLDGSPVWSADGKTIYYLFNGPGGNYAIKSVPADGSAAPIEIVSSKRTGLIPSSVSPDGATLFASEQGTEQEGKLIGVQLKEKEHRKWTLMSNGAGWPRISPDGKLMAFVKVSGSYYDLYVQPYPATGAQWQISTEGGIHPVWSKDGKRVFFLDRSANVMMSEIQTRPGFMASNPKLVYRNIYRPVGGSSSFSVAQDGKRILVMNPVEGNGAMRVLLKLNWLQTLNQPAK